MKFLGCFALFLISMSTLSSAEEEKAYNPHEFATKPEASVLPERVTRVRYIYSAYKGQSTGYDKDGSKTDAPASVDIKGGAFVFEYGITDNLSLQMLQKFVTKQSITANDSWAMAATADVRKAETQSLKSKLCAAMKVSDAACDATLATKPSAATAAALNQATGIAFDTNSTMSDTASSYVDAVVLKNVHSKADADGGRGLGDLEIGVLWNPIKQESFHFAVGTGVRLPMNKNLASYGENTTTRDVPETAVRFNLDYLPTRSLDIAFQNQSEVGIAAGKYKTGDVNATYTRKGVRNQGFLMAKPSLAGIHESLGMIGPMLGVTYDFGNEEYAKFGDADTVSLGHRGQEMKYYSGINLDFFRFGVPLNLQAEYEKSFRGSNVTVATDKTQVQLKGYYKF